MRNIIYILFVLVFSSCGESYHNERLYNIKQQYENVSRNHKRLVDDIERLSSYKQQLEQQCEELNYISKGKQIQYIVTLEIKQTSFSLDLEEHIKNDLNAVKLQIPVSKDFFNSVNKGTKLSDKMRVGSLILRGSYKKLNIIVTNKEIKTF